MPCASCSLLNASRGDIRLLEASNIPCYRITRIGSCPWVGGHGSRTHLRCIKVPPSCFQPFQMKFLQQLISKKNSKQSSPKHVTPSSTEQTPLQAAAALLETGPPKISLDNVADNLPQLDDDTLLCILQALTSPVALTKARMVSPHVSPSPFPPPDRLILRPANAYTFLEVQESYGCTGPENSTGWGDGSTCPGACFCKTPARNRCGRPS